MDLARRFYTPVQAGKRKIVTLHDAAKLYQAQPAKVRKEKPWTILFEHVARAGHHGGLWIDLCEIALRIAINGPRKQVFDPDFQESHYGSPARSDPWR